MKWLAGLFFCISICFMSMTAVVQAAPGLTANAEVYFPLEMMKVEDEHKVRIGVYAVDTETGRVISYRGDERFAYCSTAKTLIAAAVIDSLPEETWRQDIGKIIRYDEEDILSYAPETRQHVADGMTVDGLLRAAVRVSDNTAANLLLRELGGIDVFQSYLYKIYDFTTCPVRTEPELNTAVPGDPRDTTTPKQLAMDYQRILLGNALSKEKQAYMRDVMADNLLTNSLIKAGVPNEWTVFDKSGSGDFGTRNDAAVIYRTDGAPIVIVVMTTHADADAKSDDAVVALTARIVAENF